MLIKVLTSLVTRDVDAFVGFVEHLRDKLDALIIRHSADIGKVQAYIDEIEEEALPRSLDQGRSQGRDSRSPRLRADAKSSPPARRSLRSRRRSSA
jgi:hypothetical protein